LALAIYVYAAPKLGVKVVYIKLGSFLIRKNSKDTCINRPGTRTY